ncbi:MAG TPA: hypothetical protein VNT76_15960 [Candidatus Binatus sp.]|nr:hypothetical protein [Candidatus Binatus sp.]
MLVPKVPVVSDPFGGAFERLGFQAAMKITTLFFAREQAGIF